MLARGSNAFVIISLLAAAARVQAQEAHESVPMDTAPIDTAPMDTAPMDAAQEELALAEVPAAIGGTAPMASDGAGAMPEVRGDEQRVDAQPAAAIAEESEELEHVAEPAEEAPEPEASDDGWLDGLSIAAFADAYAQGVWTLADPFSGDRSDVLAQRPYTHIAGFTLAFLGLDLAYEHEDMIGARIDVRFGTGAARLIGPTSGLPDGMQFVKQLYVWWRPDARFQIDFGQFDTIYGAEVSESWKNHNYSRGALYQLAQPFYHTGFRASWSPIDELTLTALAVNGWNNVVDGNDGKTFGVQVTYSSAPLRVSAGYLAGPETDREDLWRHLADVVVALSIDDLELLANGDFVAEQRDDGSFDRLWGVMLGGRVRFPPLFALALRGEVIGDPDDGTQLYTGTFTLELTPDEHFVIRLENVVEVASDDRFEDQQGAPSETVFSTILGLVVHSS